MRRPRLRYWSRPVAFGLSIVLLVCAAILMVEAYDRWAGPGWIGLDVLRYLDVTRHWLATGSLYDPAEIAAPFTYSATTFLHPPIALYLFVPFTVLPLILWWIVPLAVVGWSVSSWHPAPWSWPLMALMLCSPRLHGVLMVGNSDLWVWAGVAAGLRFGWPALLVLIKPSLFPLALAGITRRSWWLGAVLVALASLPFGSLWVDWIAVIRNSPAGWTYSLPNLTWLLLPIVAWVGRRTDDRSKQHQAA